MRIEGAAEVSGEKGDRESAKDRCTDDVGNDIHRLVVHLR